MEIKSIAAIPDLYKVIHRLQEVSLKLLDKELAEYVKDNLIHGNKTTTAPLSYDLSECYSILIHDLTDYFTADKADDKAFQDKQDAIYKKHGIKV